MKELPDFHVNPFEDYYSSSLAIWFLVVFLFLTLFLIADLHLVSGLFSILAITLLALSLALLEHSGGEIRKRFFTKWGRVHYPLIHRFERFMGLDLFFLGVVDDALKDKPDDYFEYCEIELRLLLKSIFPQLHGTELKSYISSSIKKGKSILKKQSSIEEIFSRKDKIYKGNGKELFADIKKILSAAEKYDDAWFERELRPRLVIADLIERKYGKDEKLEYLYAVLTEEAARFLR